MIFLTQRLARNDRRWPQPTPCRLGRSGEGDYVQRYGFGHEDWNFNARLAIGGYLYAYMYYQPTAARAAERFQFAFLTWEDSTWNLVGFYHNAEFFPDGAPSDVKVLETKVRHLRALGSSLGADLVKLSDSALKKRLEGENAWLRWRVRPLDIEVLPQPIPVPESIYDARHYRITKPKEISAASFGSLENLATRSQVVQNSQTPDVDFEEGALFTVVHVARERNQKLVTVAKATFIKKHGHLFCEGCGFDFEACYGERGSGFIEAHHTVPISQLTGATLTQVKDLRMLCSNCHRMVHVAAPWLTIAELTDTLAENRANGV
jgi:HNH endonuclease